MVNYSEKDRLVPPSITAWFSVTALGQIIFSIYIVALYWVNGASGNFEAWNMILPHGYENGNFVGNTSLQLHLILAVIITLIGISQIVPSIRKRIPKFHRIGGRVYVGAALIMSLTGLYLILSGRKVVGDAFQHTAIFINSLYILCFASLALWRALNKDFRSHRKWALRLFISVSGVWLFRVGLMAWLLIHQGPVGFDRETFSGPFLTALSFSVYILPVAIAELYFQAQERDNIVLKWLFTIIAYLITAITMLGIFGATAGMWIPRVFG